MRQARRDRQSLALGVIVGISLAVVGGAVAGDSVSGGQTMRVSVSSSGAEADPHGYYEGAEEPAISSSGRFVAFWSSASTLTADDTNGRKDVFVRDLQDGTTSRASLTSSGSQSRGDSTRPALSADGRYVAFFSLGTLVPGDTNR